MGSLVSQRAAQKRTTPGHDRQYKLIISMQVLSVRVLCVQATESCGTATLYCPIRTRLHESCNSSYRGSTCSDPRRWPVCTSQGTAKTCNGRGLHSHPSSGMLHSQVVYLWDDRCSRGCSTHSQAARYSPRFERTCCTQASRVTRDSGECDYPTCSRRQRTASRGTHLRTYVCIHLGNT